MHFTIISSVALVLRGYGSSSSPFPDTSIYFLAKTILLSFDGEIKSNFVKFAIWILPQTNTKEPELLRRVQLNDLKSFSANIYEVFHSPPLNVYSL